MKLMRSLAFVPFAILFYGMARYDQRVFIAVSLAVCMISFGLLIYFWFDMRRSDKRMEAEEDALVATNPQLKPIIDDIRRIRKGR
jgi:heme/copper-type cytochrome/quinol oxidase subunit 4